ncbi:CheY-like superfamily [Pavlovales sp. CCMP2436]|nr:CheY-like superfamily [Pavlovales sp. CCMP2436]
MTEQLTDGSRPPRKVLVVDDSCVCRAWLIAMCKRLYDGVELAQANDGDEAVEAFERELRTGAPYDLVLMDLNMVGDDDERPQLTGMLDERNGPQASARIRRAEYAAAHDSGTLTHANVIVITGSTRTDRWDLAYYHGCGIDGILCKPVSKAALSAAVTATQRR